MSPSNGSDSITRNAFFALASQLATASFTAAITVFLVRALDPGGYGLFALALGFAGLVALPADFGVSSSSARYIAERRGDASAIAAVLWKALMLKLVLTSLIAATLIALAGPIAGLYDQPALAWPVRGVAIALLAQNILFLFASAFVAMGRIAWQFVATLSEAAIEATATVTLVLLAGGATAAAFGRAVGYVCGALLAAALIIRLLGRRAVTERRGAPKLRQLALYAGALLIVDGAYAVFNYADVLIVGALLGATAAGIYGAPLKLVALLHYPGLALAQAIAPQMARHSDEPAEVGAFVGGLRLILIVQTPIAVGVAVWAEPIVSLLLGPGYEQSADVLRALAPFIFLSGIGPLVSIAVNYLGEARRRIPIAVGSALLHIILTVFLVESIGIIGAAVSTSATYGLYVGGHIWICRWLVGLPLRPLIATVARTIPAGAALAAVLLAIGTGDLGAVQWIAGIVGGTIAFLALLIVTGETSPSELSRLPDVFRRRLRRAEA